MINPNELSLKKKIIISISLIVVFAAITVGVVFLVKFISYNNKVNAVKNTLEKVPTVMQQAKLKYGAYPADIDNIEKLSNKDVQVSGGSSFDGTTYCVAGVSLDDKTIVYHIDSSSDKATAGSCSTSTQLSAPGGVAVAFVNTTDLKITWGSTAGASSYTLECAKDSSFQNAITVKTTKTEGVCKNLVANTDYYYRVLASNSASVSKWSMIQKITTNP